MSAKRTFCFLAFCTWIFPGGSLAQVSPEMMTFHRGDANADGSVNLSDAVSTFGFLFLGDDAPPCKDAADSNDDGEINISDGVYTLNFLFTGGSPIPDPDQSECGRDGNPDELDCERYRPCVCGGILGWPCPKGHFCDFPPGFCGGADMQGVCVLIEEICPEYYSPVCGCDGVTYGNDCERIRAGAQKDHDGPCVKVCGGIMGTPCPKGEFCEFAPGTCEIVDNQGECVEIPVVCPAVFDPVCGCDGVTYGNDCERRLAQVSKYHDGPCEGPPGGEAAE